MAYAILRLEKTKNTSLAGKNSHNMRLRKTHTADPNLQSQNRILIGSFSFTCFFGLAMLVYFLLVTYSRKKGK